MEHANHCVDKHLLWLALVRRSGLILMAILFVLPGQHLGSQQAGGAEGQTPRVTAQVKVVNVFATVRDKKGQIVRDLTANDFDLQEDSRPQLIRYFARESDLPLTLGLLVDTSMSQRHVLGEERDASATFLDQVLRPSKDQAFVIHFDREVELLQDVTSSRQKLQASLNLLEVPQRSTGAGGDSSGSSGQGPGAGRRGRGGWGGGGTTLYDAIYLASKEIMAKQDGRKAIIVFSDGVDRGSKETLAASVEAAQRANTLVYSILFAEQQEYGGGGFGHRGMGGGMGGPMGRRGGGYPRPQESRPDGKKILERISTETGGRCFETSKKHPLDQTFDQINEELRQQYSLGYTPNPPDMEPAYHKIILTARKKDLTVQARSGYYSGP